jgi:hypothetical protein
VITLAENSSAENDEEYGRADGRAYIMLGKVSGPYRKAQRNLRARRGQRDEWEKGFEGERKGAAIREKRRSVMCEHGGGARVRAERRVSDIVIMDRRMARTGHGRSQSQENNPETPAEA